MAAMQRQAAAMDPAQMQQAMNMFQNLTPQQRQSMAQAASNVSPDTFTQQASTAQTQFSAREKYEIDASERLKTEGNRLHGLKEFDQASEKYQRALSNLSAHTSSSAATLRISCMGNLASCYLQLRKWDDCIQQCNNVLGFDASNRKALYRRGQALTAVGRADEAVRDLKKALELSPESEKPTIKEKLEEALQKQHHAARGIVIEEAGDEKDTTAEIPQGEQHEDIQSKESNVESEEDDDERPPLVDEEPTRIRLAPEARASSFTGVQ
jgi:tetratricopeptide (TPR) repeat protein